MIVFGPVPSRRLGQSLGINHVPRKVCTYSCVYCQVGRTTSLRSNRCPFLDPDTVAEAVRAKLGEARLAGLGVDYLSFVPEGEPMLDRGIGATIRLLWPLGIPIAVVTNSSLLDYPDVRRELSDADWVSLKVDTVGEARWRQLNRPHGRLGLERILDGVREFVAGFRGRLVTETMLVAGVNDGEAELRATASFIGTLRPAVAYLAVPTRPPAEPWVKPAAAASLARAYEVFRALAGRTELLVDYEGDAFAPTGDPRLDLLAITAVHPMRAEAVARFLGRARAPSDVLDDLVREGELVETTYGGHHYFLRPTRPPSSRSGPGGGSAQRTQKGAIS